MVSKLFGVAGFVFCPVAMNGYKFCAKTSVNVS